MCPEPRPYRPPRPSRASADISRLNTTPWLAAAPFLAAGAAAALAAWAAALAIENHAEGSVARALAAEDVAFAAVEADGLRLTLAGTAPSEAQRFRALTVAGRHVDPARVIDAMAVEGGATLEPPAFAVEVLRARSGVSLIGLVPEGTDRAALADRLARETDEEVSDFLEVSPHPAPEGWDAAMSFAVEAVGRLERSKVSAEPGRVAVVAAAESPERREAALRALRRAAPRGLEVALDVSAPRPVIAPYPLRFEGATEVEDAEGAIFRLDACAASTPEAARAIEAAAEGAGADDPACRVGLGAPTPRWAEGAARAIEAVAELGGGSVTIADADVTLVAPEGLAPRRFDAVAGRLQGALPPAFSLHAVPPEAAREPGAARFAAELADERLTMSGQLPDTRAREAAQSLARARFAGAEVRAATREAEDLPEGWSLRAMAGLEALALLDEGRVEVREDGVRLAGRTGDREAEGRAAGLLTRALGGGEDIVLEVAYEAALDPAEAGPTPEACMARIEAAHDVRKITFASGSDEIEPAGLATVGEIARILAECPPMRVEVAGHTDSQGREGMNLALSRERAVAVVEALRARRAPVAGLVPRGYGEAHPVADNETAAGREANRRIEFVLRDEAASAPVTRAATGAALPRPSGTPE